MNIPRKKIMLAILNNVLHVKLIFVNCYVIENSLSVIVNTWFITSCMYKNYVCEKLMYSSHYYKINNI